MDANRSANRVLLFLPLPLSLSPSLPFSLPPSLSLPHLSLPLFLAEEIVSSRRREVEHGPGPPSASLAEEIVNSRCREAEHGLGPPPSASPEAPAIVRRPDAALSPPFPATDTDPLTQIDRLDLR